VFDAKLAHTLRAKEDVLAALEKGEEQEGDDLEKKAVKLEEKKARRERNEKRRQAKIAK